MRALILAVAILAAAPAFAVQPDEMLSDPELEARAREISRDLRCPVCQGENIDDSNAQISRDLRLLVRERLTAGDTNDQVIAYIVDRYGEFVLFDPPAKGANLALWLAGPVMLLAGAGIAVLTLRSRSRAARLDDRLTEAEEARLKELLKG